MPLSVEGPAARGTFAVDLIDIVATVRARILLPDPLPLSLTSAIADTASPNPCARSLALEEVGASRGGAVVHESVCTTTRNYAQRLTGRLTSSSNIGSQKTVVGVFSVVVECGYAATSVVAVEGLSI